MLPGVSAGTGHLRRASLTVICDLPLAHTFPLRASRVLPRRHRKPRHTPLASAVSYDNAVNSAEQDLGPGRGAGEGLFCSYGKGVFTSVFCMSVLPPGQLGVCATAG